LGSDADSVGLTLIGLKQLDTCYRSYQIRWDNAK